MMANINIVQQTCCKEGCGIAFWIEENYHDSLLVTKRSFYCPNGHSQSYTGESDKAKIIRLQNEKAQMQREHALEIAKIKKLKRKK
jgi:hypothetical protein